MLIVISGQAGSGKDTLADFLVKNHNFTKIAFADPLKRIVMDLYGFTEEQLWGSSEMRNKADKRYPREHTWESEMFGVRCDCCGMEFGNVPLEKEAAQCYLTPRYALQHIGTNGFRHCYEGTWADYTMRVANELLEHDQLAYHRAKGIIPCDTKQYNTGVVITDCRFKNEIKTVKASGGQVVRIVRTGAGLAEHARKHQSESEMRDIPDDAFDIIITNDGSLEDLEQKAQEIFLAGEMNDPIELVHGAQLPEGGFIKFGH